MAKEMVGANDAALLSQAKVTQPEAAKKKWKKETGGGPGEAKKRTKRSLSPKSKSLDNFPRPAPSIE